MAPPLGDRRPGGGAHQRQGAGGLRGGRGGAGRGSRPRPAHERPAGRTCGRERSDVLRPRVCSAAAALLHDARARRRARQRPRRRALPLRLSRRRHDAARRPRRRADLHRLALLGAGPRGGRAASSWSRPSAATSSPTSLRRPQRTRRRAAAPRLPGRRPELRRRTAGCGAGTAAACATSARASAACACVKDAAEIALMRRAAALTDEALAAVVGRGPRRAAREADVAWRLQDEFHRLGAEGEAFPAIVAAGDHGAQAHAIPGERVIAAGELVVIDTGARVDGYCSDITRTFAAGEPADELRARVRRRPRGAARRPRGRARRRSRPRRRRRGRPRASSPRRATASSFGHGTGHGVGLEVHEAPRSAASRRRRARGRHGLHRRARHLPRGPSRACASRTPCS